MAAVAVLKWLRTHRLLRHKDTLMGENNLGLTTLEDLRMLSDADIQDVTSMCEMNIGERNRFATEVKRLQGRLELPPDNEVPETATRESGSPSPVAQAAVQPSTAELLPQATVQPRAWKPVTEFASPSAAAGGFDQQGPAPSPATPAGASPPRAVEEGDKAKPRAPRATSSDSARGGDEGKQEAEEEGPDWFEVVKSMVLVKNFPNPQATDIGCLAQGERLQAKKEREYDRDGHAWVALTALQMLVSCEGCDPQAQGYILIDGTHLGLGPLLREQSDPAPKTPQPEPERAVRRAPETADRATSSDSDDDEAQRRAAPRSFRPSPFKAMGAKPQSQWQGGARASDAELRRQQEMARQKKAATQEEELDLRNARKARAERMQKAQAVKAQKEKEEAEEEERKKRQQEMSTASSEDDDVVAEEERKQRESRMEEQWSLDMAWDRLQQECESKQQAEKALRQSATVYRSVYDLVYTMRPGDPSTGSISRLNCQPGTAFFATGEKWSGPQGGVWLARQGPASFGGRAREEGWVLLHSPDSPQDDPWLIRETQIDQPVRVEVKYLGERRSFRLFENCLPSTSKVRALKARVGAETGLRAGSIVLLPRQGAPVEARRQGELRENEEGLPDQLTLGECGLRGEVCLFMLYTSNFEEHFRDGRLLRKGTGKERAKQKK